MHTDKRLFLIELENFLESLNDSYPGKCYFRMLDGQQCQGWIYNVGETTFEYLDSGPFAAGEPYVFAIADIDKNSFSYWDEAAKGWVDYRVPDKMINRNKD